MSCRKFPSFVTARTHYPVPLHLHCIRNLRNAMHCNALQSTALHCIESHCNVLHCTVLHRTALHSSALLSVMHCCTAALSVLPQPVACLILSHPESFIRISCWQRQPTQQALLYLHTYAFIHVQTYACTHVHMYTRTHVILYWYTCALAQTHAALPA